MAVNMACNAVMTKMKILLILREILGLVYGK